MVFYGWLEIHFWEGGGRRYIFGSYIFGGEVVGDAFLAVTFLGGRWSEMHFCSII